MRWCCRIAALALAATTSGCAGRAHVTSTPPRDERLATTLEARCGACHDGDPGRPDLRASTPLTANLAVRAALAIESGRMPPRGPLPAGERHELVRALCAAGAPDPARCVEAVTSAWRVPLAREPHEVARAIDRAIPAGKSDGDVMTSFAEHVQIDAVHTYVDPTYLLSVGLLVAERCAAEQGPAYDACLARGLDRLKYEALPYPTDGGAAHTSAAP